MGADFMFTKTPVFSMTEDRKKILAEELSNLTPNDYENLRMELFWDDESESEIQERCLDMIEEVMDMGEPRDSALVYEYNKNGQQMMTLITGGMSHGDAPTDTFDIVSSINHIPVWDTIERFAIEDCEVLA